MALRLCHSCSVGGRVHCCWQVLLNGNKLPITSFQKYCDMYASSRRRPRGNPCVCGLPAVGSHLLAPPRRRIVVQFNLDSHIADHAAPMALPLLVCGSGIAQSQ